MELTLQTQTTYLQNNLKPYVNLAWQMQKDELHSSVPSLYNTSEVIWSFLRIIMFINIIPALSYFTM